MNARVTLGQAGRVVIPKSLRDKLHLSPGDTLELESEGENIVLRPVHATGSMRKEKGMWVFYGGTGKTIALADVNALVEEDREERHRRNLGEA